jgi:hypothetical protein
MRPNISAVVEQRYGADAVLYEVILAQLKAEHPPLKEHWLPPFFAV